MNMFRTVFTVMRKELRDLSRDRRTLALALFLGPLLLNRAYVVGAAVSLVLFTAFMLFFRTRRGVVLRAIADDYTASWSVGISVERGVALSWALSSVVATTAGVLWGSVQTVDQTLAMLLLKGITVAVLGGMDSLGGAILAGLLLGILESVASGVLDPLLGGGTRELVVAAVLILTIMIRPHGLFGLLAICGLGPEDDAGITDLQALAVVLAAPQQVVEHGGVGKGGLLRDRCVVALAFAVGSE